ncbi:hypothetical protein CRV02_12820 [Arcobacter sp. CECT 8989]|nr:hypothetical protein CRV02_12820 [Arcobacter sp. CECT 8989]
MNCIKCTFKFILLFITFSCIFIQLLGIFEVMDISSETSKRYLIIAIPAALLSHKIKCSAKKGTYFYKVVEFFDRENK